MPPAPCTARRRSRSAQLASLLLASAALLALAAAPARSSPLQPPPQFWGVITQSERPQSDFALMKRGGVDSVRFGFGWDGAEKQPGTYDFGPFDHYVTQAALAGLDVFPAVNSTPSFYASDSRTLPVATAEQRTAWANYLKALVQRYGPSGDFWTQHPNVPRHPIVIWQIWNEANFFYFAEPRSPELYGQLVKISHDAIKSVDPKATIVLAGLFGHPKEQPPQAYQAADFLDQLYDVPNIKDYFDGVGLHPYALDASDLPDDIGEIRDVMHKHADDSTGLYLTELGWGDGTDTGFEKGPEGQLREMSEAFDILIAMQRTARIQRVFWYAWDDVSGSCRFCDSVGLLDETGNPKPAWDRFVSYSGCFGGFTTILGTAASETINGTPGNDVIVAGAGDDTILANGGDDKICTEDGNDTIVSGSGRDFVSGGPGTDKFKTGAGADWIFGDPGNDTVAAGVGADRVLGDIGAEKVSGGPGPDVLFGDEGADLLIGNGDDDKLFGSFGNDRLFGNAGDDKLFGNAGKDKLFGLAGDDLLNGGAGKDVLKPGQGTNVSRP